MSCRSLWAFYGLVLVKGRFTHDKREKATSHIPPCLDFTSKELKPPGNAAAHNPPKALGIIPHPASSSANSPAAHPFLWFELEKHPHHLDLVQFIKISFFPQNCPNFSWRSPGSSCLLPICEQSCSKAAKPDLIRVVKQ